jgi:hypothetical protein
MRRKILIGLLVVTLLAAGFAAMVREARADAVPVESYIISQLVVEINRVVTILNSVLDSNNALTGDITTDDITAAGADTASLDFNYPASTNSQMATVTHKSATAVGSMADNNYVRYIMLDAVDASTNANNNYVYADAKATDETHGSEDGQWELGFMSGGSLVEVLIGSSAAGAMAMTLPAGMEASVDGKWAAVGPDATTGQMVLGADVTATGTTMTNAFATAFGAAPRVVCTYIEAATTNIYLGTVTASNFISFHESSKNYNYIAVGQRP